MTYNNHNKQTRTHTHTRTLTLTHAYIHTDIHINYEWSVHPIHRKLMILYNCNLFSIGKEHLSRSLHKSINVAYYNNFIYNCVIVICNFILWSSLNRCIMINSFKMELAELISNAMPIVNIRVAVVFRLWHIICFKTRNKYTYVILKNVTCTIKVHHSH